VLLVWDAPNMDMSLGSLLGARPTSTFRPRFDAVGRWLLDLAGPEATAEATVLRHIAMRADEGVLQHVVVASGDGRAFREPLEELVAKGAGVTVIGFREYATFALQSEVIEFVDLEDIDGVFREPLPRMTLDTLPDGGAWLPPFRSLRSLLDPRR